MDEQIRQDIQRLITDINSIQNDLGTIEILKQTVEQKFQNMLELLYQLEQRLADNTTNQQQQQQGM